MAVLYAQIIGGRVACESEATLQLHLGRILSLAADLEIVAAGESLTIELEKPFDPTGDRRGRIDIWFAITSYTGGVERCALELKFFKKANHREPNNRYDVFRDMARLEACGSIADAAFMLVMTDHDHYPRCPALSPDTSDFDFRQGTTYWAGTEMTYRTGGYGPPITLAGDYEFKWEGAPGGLQYMLAQVALR
ncbi:MAG: hypothetical protein WBR13_03080 [Allosphingosinicella sp.]